MSNNTTLKTLSTALHGNFPYEYDVLYTNSEDAGNNIAISKVGSNGIIYITAPDDDGILDVTLYDDAYDDEPTELSQWDTNDPNLNLTDLITYVEKTL